MDFYAQAGLIAAAIMTLCQLSLVFGDNFFFKWSTRVVIGFSVVHAAVQYAYWTDYYGIQPLLKGDIKWIIGLVLCLMMYGRLTSRYAWISKYPMGLQLGVGFGTVIISIARTQILDQIRVTISEILAADSAFALFNRLLILLGVISVISYFFFTREQNGVLGRLSYVGRAFIMSSIDVIWAGDYIWAMSMMAGRLQFIIRDFYFGLLLGGS